jgi:hypothetical protein
MSGFVERMIEEGFVAGDPKELGQLLWAASHGLIVLHLAGKLSPKPGFRALHGAMMRLLVRGARAMPDAAQAARHWKSTRASP